MKKRITAIAAALSLIPIGQPLLVGGGAALTSAAVMLSVPQQAKADNSVFYYHRGVERQNVGNYSGAISDYSKAIEINPRYGDAYYNRGLAKRQLRDYSGAIADYNKAIEINPRDAEAYNNRGWVKVDKLQNYSGGIADYNKAIKINPKLKNAYFNRGKAKYYIGDKKGACDDYKKARYFGSQAAREWWATESADWCRDM